MTSPVRAKGPVPGDRLWLDLKGARERLCRAQVSIPAHWRAELDLAVRCIDLVGSAVCPDQWSIYDQPEWPTSGSSSTGSRWSPEPRNADAPEEPK